MDVTKLYKLIYALGPWMSPTPCKFISFGAMYVTKPFKFIRFAPMDPQHLHALDPMNL